MLELHDLIGSLEDMRVDALRSVWRARLGEPPPVRAGDILRRALAEKLQEEAFGFDDQLRHRLNGLVARYRPGRKPRVRNAKYRPGSRLSREWNGRHYVVEVIDAGFVWNGERYSSLSVIARKITGVRRNGPRFFGLRGGGA
jgi:hypothetical protein